MLLGAGVLSSCRQREDVLTLGAKNKANVFGVGLLGSMICSGGLQYSGVCWIPLGREDWLCFCAVFLDERRLSLLSEK